MNNSFILNNTLYHQLYYPLAIVGMNILPRLFGTTIKDLTYKELLMIAAMLNRGWDILPQFQINDGEVKAIYNQFMLWYEQDGSVIQYIAMVNFDDYTITLCDDSHQIAVFTDLDDMYKCMPQLNKTLPLMCKFYDNENDEDNLNAVQFDDIENEIDFNTTKVYENMDNNRLKFILNKNKIFVEDFVGKA